MNESRIEIIALLRGQFESHKAKHAGYSLRRFAKKLGVQVPVLSEVLRGKRPITRRLATQLLNPLDLDASKKFELIHAIPDARAEEEKKSAHVLKRIELSCSEFEVVSDWWHFAILALVDSGWRDANPKKLAKKFNLTQTKTKHALENLTSQGLIQIENGIVTSTGRTFTTSVDIPSPMIQANHRQGLDLAQEALASVPVLERDFSAITMTCNPKQLPQIKEKLQEMRREISSSMRATEGSTVYRLQIQLFPVSNYTTSRKTKESKNA